MCTKRRSRLLLLLAAAVVSERFGEDGVGVEDWSKTFGLCVCARACVEAVYCEEKLDDGFALI